MIYIDVDDTLIDEHDNPRPLVMAAAWLAIAKRVPVTIWSGAGSEYASRWARWLFPGQVLVTMAKDNKLPLAGDIVVDDMIEFVLPYGVLILQPLQFAEWMFGTGMFAR